MAKKISNYVKLQVPAGQANPSPPIGPALGQAGLNIMEFCKAFNAETQGMEAGMPIPVVITVYSDRSFTYVTKTPPAAVLLFKALGIKGGSGRPNSEKVGKASRAQLEEIAKMKEPDLTAADLDAHCKSSILSSYKRPRGYIFLDELPRNAANKVLRRVLKTKAEEARKSEGFFSIN